MFRLRTTAPTIHALPRIRTLRCRSLPTLIPTTRWGRLAARLQELLQAR